MDAAYWRPNVNAADFFERGHKIDVRSDGNGFARCCCFRVRNTESRVWMALWWKGMGKGEVWKKLAAFFECRLFTLCSANLKAEKGHLGF